MSTKRQYWTLVIAAALILAVTMGLRNALGLFGLTLLTHQIGGFFGAWLGGLAVAMSGNYDWMWYADIALATAAALVNLPIREAPPKLAAAAA